MLSNYQNKAIKERLEALSLLVTDLQNERDSHTIDKQDTGLRELEDLLKQKDYLILELKQRLANSSSSEAVKDQGLPDRMESNSVDPNIMRSMQQEIKRFRAILEKKEYYTSQLLKDYEVLKLQIEQERIARQDLRLERQYKIASEDLRNLEISYDRLKQETNEIIRNKNIELDQLVKSISEIREKYESHIEILEKDIKRLRKERDSSRELYEQLNGQMSIQVRIVEDLKTKLKIVDTENTEYRKKISSSLPPDDELSVLCEAFESLEHQHSELSDKFREREELVNTLKAEKLKAEFEASQVNRQLDQQLAKLKSSQAALNLSLTESTERESKLRAKILQLEEKLLTSMPKPVQTGERSNEPPITESNLPLDKIAEVESKYKALKYENSYLRSELENSRKVLDDMYSNGGVSVQELRDQIDLYQKLLKCNSCKTRDKNAIITKCMHVFCKDCLDTRIETRQRKCPNCGESFGQGDIKNIYL